LPHGELIEPAARDDGASGAVRVHLPLQARQSVQALIERLDGDATRWVGGPSHVDESGAELVLEYALEPAASTSFAVALPGLRARLAEHLPALIEGAQYLAMIAQALDRGEVRVLLSPLCLRYMPERREGAWRLLVFPLAETSVADWALASPQAWAWTPAPRLLARAGDRGDPGDPGGTRDHARAYAVGALLASALAGGLFPEELPPGACFTRALRGWVGSPARCTAAAREALPASFSDEAAALATLAIELLDAAPPSDWEARLDQLAAQLAPYRTAVRWEYEGNLDVAHAILERCARSTPAPRVPWDVVGRLRARRGDLRGALQAALEGVLALDASDAPREPSGELPRELFDERLRELAAAIRRAAGEGAAGERATEPIVIDPATLRAIEQALDALAPRASRLGDLARLHFAHVEARYLSRFGDAQRRLARPAAAPWDEIVRGLVLARCHAGCAEWAHVARLCKQARAAVVAMSQGGGGLGRYAVAYLDHLDGVAHHGAVRQYGDPGYLADAFSRLVASLDWAVAHRAEDAAAEALARANVHWLHRVAALAAHLQVPEAKAITAGVTAYLAASGLVERGAPQVLEGPGEQLLLAWYDDARLLVLSGVG
jgi:hypothetical protein